MLDADTAGREADSLLADAFGSCLIQVQLPSTGGGDRARLNRAPLATPAPLETLRRPSRLGATNPQSSNWPNQTLVGADTRSGLHSRRLGHHAHAFERGQAILQTPTACDSAPTQLKEVHTSPTHGFVRRGYPHEEPTMRAVRSRPHDDTIALRRHDLIDGDVEVREVCS